MSQHDYDIANQGFSAFRADMNLAFIAAQTCNSGASAPASPQTGQLWRDTDTPSATLQAISMYDGTDWVPWAYLDVTNNRMAYPVGTVSLPGIPFQGDPDSGLYWIGANDIGMATAGALSMEWAADGAVLTALQPRCLARVSSSETNVTGDGTVKTIVFATEAFDVGADFDGTSTYTFAKTGKYLVTVNINCLQAGAGHTRLILRALTTAQNFNVGDTNPSTLLATGTNLGGSFVCSATAGDTMTFTLTGSGGTLTIDIDTTSAASFFSVAFLG